MKDPSIIYLHLIYSIFINFKIICTIVYKISSGLSQLSQVWSGRWCFRAWKKAEDTIDLFKTDMASL